MPRIIDYSYLFKNLPGAAKAANPIGSFQLSNLNSRSVQAQLRAAGIDTNSKQYKAVIKEMMQASKGNGAMYTNIHAIKNSMKSYDQDGDYIDPTNGLAGLLLTEENAASASSPFLKAARKKCSTKPKKNFSRKMAFQTATPPAAPMSTTTCTARSKKMTAWPPATPCNNTSAPTARPSLPPQKKPTHPGQSAAPSPPAPWTK